MVVDRLGMDTSGDVVFACTAAALRGTKTAFRNRSVTRSYEALVCGSIEEVKGVISMPIMRDSAYPPYMHVSTDDQQHALLFGLTAEDAGKKLLERPKGADKGFPNEKDPLSRLFDKNAKIMVQRVVFMILRYLKNIGWDKVFLILVIEVLQGVWTSTSFLAQVKLNADGRDLIR